MEWLTRKKVIRGLTCCQTINEYCDECPYNRIGYDQCSKAMHKDALELLKEQAKEPVSSIIQTAMEIQINLEQEEEE